MSLPLTVSMKTIISLIAAYMALIVFGTTSVFLLISQDITNPASLIVLPLLIALFVLCRQGRPWAYVATVVVGVIITIVSAPLPGTPNRS